MALQEFPGGHSLWKHGYASLIEYLSFSFWSCRWWTSANLADVKKVCCSTVQFFAGLEIQKRGQQSLRQNPNGPRKSANSWNFVTWNAPKTTGLVMASLLKPRSWSECDFRCSCGVDFQPGRMCIHWAAKWPLLPGGPLYLQLGKSLKSELTRD